MSRIILADDHLIVAQGVAGILNKEHDVIAIAQSGEELIALVKQHNPELVITDVSMGDMTGIAASAAIQRLNKDIKIICLTMHEEQEYAEGAFAAGALGYVLKNEAANELIQAVETVLSGEKYLSKSITINEDKPQLTSRQLSVLRLLAQGKSAKQVADELFISSRTVEFHKYTMMKLIDVKTGAALVQYALRHGLVK
ncbi:response regulator transcription factor [Vibrio rotiferianus]|uniref:response regulator transcription factor n=1 Tax=Vibrio rotiferianus TaxID=190895 RepID=UPI000B599029|nr:response regulator transcription factor [Vibrio rotiferianus]ASI94857.1 DNA-binding response regulator [Vibrio rotiferianus]